VRVDKLGAVVVHYRREDSVLQVLEDLAHNGVSPALTVVVDNGSRAEFSGALQAAHPHVQLLRFPANPGYAEAANQGISLLATKASVDAIVLCTHEVRIPTETIERLVGQLAQPHVGCVGPLLGDLSRPGSVWSAGGSISKYRQLAYNRGKGEQLNAWLGGAPRDVDWLDGAFLLIRLAAWCAVGGFSSDYFLYMEETDFLWRLRSAGWSVRFDPTVQVSQSAGRLPRYLAVRNRTLLLRRNGRRLARLFWYAETVGRLVLGIRSPAGRAGAGDRFCGLRDGISGQLSRKRIRPHE